MKILSNQRFMVRKINLCEGRQQNSKTAKKHWKKEWSIRKKFLCLKFSFFYFEWNTLTHNSFIIFIQKHLKPIYSGKLWNQHQTNLGYLKQVHSNSLKFIWTYFILRVSNICCHLLSKILSSESAFKLSKEMRQNVLKSQKWEKNNPMNYSFFWN